MDQTFAYDIFLSHSSKDKRVVLDLVQRLEANGLRIWFYEREIKAGEHILTKIQAGLNASRLLVLACSKNGMGSEWAMLETSAFLSPDPLNKEGRFIPLRLDDTKITGILGGFSHVEWRERSKDEYALLLNVLRAKTPTRESGSIDHASVARVYDYFLGGHYNTKADLAAAKELLKSYPDFKRVVISNRAFLRRSVRFLSEAGIKQFLDIGSGLPTRGNTHEIAQSVCPDAKVVYVDNDKQVFEASRNLIEGQPNIQVVMGDLKNPESILSSPELKSIDFRKPVGLLLAAVLHFITNDDLAFKSVEVLKRKLVSGSYIVISHASRSKTLAPVTRPFGDTYSKIVTPVIQRSRKTLRRFFKGTALVKPGLVFSPAWHPNINDPFIPTKRLPFVKIPHKSIMRVGVGRV